MYFKVKGKNVRFIAVNDYPQKSVLTSEPSSDMYTTF